MTDEDIDIAQDCDNLVTSLVKRDDFHFCELKMLPIYSVRIIACYVSSIFCNTLYIALQSAILIVAVLTFLRFGLFVLL